MQLTRLLAQYSTQESITSVFNIFAIIALILLVSNVSLIIKRQSVPDYVRKYMHVSILSGVISVIITIVISLFLRFLPQLLKTPLSLLVIFGTPSLVGFFINKRIFKEEKTRAPYLIGGPAVYLVIILIILLLIILTL